MTCARTSPLHPLKSHLPFVVIVIASASLASGCWFHSSARRTAKSIVTAPLRVVGIGQAKTPPAARVQPVQLGVITQPRPSSRSTRRTHVASTRHRSRVDTPKATTIRRSNQTKRTQTVSTPTRRRKSVSDTNVSYKRVQVKPRGTLIRDSRQCGIVQGKEPVFTRHFQDKCHKCVAAGETYRFETAVLQGCDG